MIPGPSLVPCGNPLVEPVERLQQLVAIREADRVSWPEQDFVDVVDLLSRCCLLNKLTEVSFSLFETDFDHRREDTTPAKAGCRERGTLYSRIQV